MFKLGKVEPIPDWVAMAIPSTMKSVVAVDKKKKAPMDFMSEGEAKTRAESFLKTLPSDVQDLVTPYQKQGLAFCIKNCGRVLVGDEMGLGKTLQALLTAANYKSDWPCLIIAPSSLRSVWRDEAIKWLSHILQPHEVQVLWNGKAAVEPNAKLVVVSYDLVRRQEKFRKTANGEQYKILICDECHALKNKDAKQTQAITPICTSARRVLLLSGTPALNKPYELWAQLRCVAPTLFPKNFREFALRYADEEMKWYGGRCIKNWGRSKNQTELNAVLNGTVMIRRLKKDVLTQLPDKRRNKITMEDLDKKAVKEVQELMEGWKNPGEEGKPADGKTHNLFKLTCQAKKTAVIDYVEYLIDADCKFLLFAHHQEMMDAL